MDGTSYLNQSMIQMDLNARTASYAVFGEERFEPCKVCGEPTSGWHCGAVTCEACKKFFLRSINGEDSKYKCVRNKDCVIDRATRTQCQFCRFKKCKEVGMTINENLNNPTIAELFKAFPCSVCKAASSGVHFGAITCEGCKGFFRRSIKERAPERYKCMDHGNCEVSVATRNMCRYCRFQRCLQAGMSADNSRIGRQSNLFKQQIMDLQRRGICPNSDYLNNAQRKTKSYKMNKTLSNEDNLFFKDHKFNMTTQDYYPQNNQIINPLSAPTNYMYADKQQDLVSNDFSNINYDQFGNNYYYDDQSMIQQSNPSSSYQNQEPAANLYEHMSLDAFACLHDVRHLTGHFRQITLDMVFDRNLADILKCYRKSYVEFKYSILTAFEERQTQQQLMNPPYLQMNSYDSDTDAVLDILRIYGNKFAKFVESIPEVESYNKEDQNELMKSSAHIVIMLILQQECQYFNYFNCDDNFNQKLLKLFPVFSHSNYFIRQMKNTFVNYKLDEVEYSLYSLIIVSSTANLCLNDTEKINDTREKYARILRGYMLARRNEDSTYENLLILLMVLREFNNMISRGIIESFERLTRKDLKTIRSLNLFTRVFLPKTMAM